MTELRGTWSPHHQEIANLATFSPGFEEPGEGVVRRVLRKLASQSTLSRFRRGNDSPSRTSSFGFFRSFSAQIFRMGRHDAQRVFMNRKASRESCSSDLNMRRQILVAAARSERASPKASTTIQPSYFTSLSVLNVVSQST